MEQRVSMADSNPVGRPPKSEAQKQDDEAQRLLRPSTKVLAPRRDKQRNIVDPDKATKSEAGKSAMNIQEELLHIASEIEKSGADLSVRDLEDFIDAMEKFRKAAHVVNQVWMGNIHELNSFFGDQRKYQQVFPSSFNDWVDDLDSLVEDLQSWVRQHRG